MKSNDDSPALVEQVRRAADSGSPLRIVGGDSKHFLGNRPADQGSAESLDVNSHCGIISYEPTELVVTVRAGTSMIELLSVLDEAGQMLPFEPPTLAGSTIGGVIACGLSGPRRPFSGAARDYVLGTRIINGQGQDLAFGGEVMKNVAGYDVSRVQVGAWGTLGLLLDISMKVLPRAESEVTLLHESNEHDTRGFSPLMRRPLPLSGAMLIGQQRYLRLSGSDSAVRAVMQDLGGDVLAPSESGIWDAVRNHEHMFFSERADNETLWRISVADHAPALELAGEWLYEWAGAQRWLKSSAPAADVYAAARAAGGHAIRYGGGSASQPAFQPLDGAMLRLQARLRDSFDPQRLFNRGRFHPELDDAGAGDSASAGAGAGDSASASAEQVTS